jgi:hypothetical protein
MIGRSGRSTTLHPPECIEQPQHPRVAIMQTCGFRRSRLAECDSGRGGWISIPSLLTVLSSTPKWVGKLCGLISLDVHETSRTFSNHLRSLSMRTALRGKEKSRTGVYMRTRIREPMSKERISCDTRKRATRVCGVTMVSRKGIFDRIRCSASSKPPFGATTPQWHA